MKIYALPLPKSHDCFLTNSAHEYGGGKRGFALIVTISVMALLMMIALAMLSLSTIELRNTTNGKAAAEAQANARVSLLMAIARLQQTAGPDTRVTASAEAIAGVNGTKQLTGVWRSWEGEDHNADGMPIAPDYDSKTVADSGAGSGRFLGWLISGDQAEKSVNSPPELKRGANTVALLANGTLGTNSNSEVHLQPTPLMNGGTYAWWITGENSKARLKQTEVASGKYEANTQMLLSPGPSGSAFNVEDTTEIDRAVTRHTVNFLRDDDSALPSEYFHDLTAYSSGLLTNVANGGWKRDLSLWSENWDDIDEGFSAFTLSPGEVWSAGKSNRDSSSNPLIYSWSNWTRSPFQNSVSWAALADYANQYKQLNTSGNAVSEIDDSTAYQKDSENQQWELADTIRRMPVLARVHTVFSLSAKEVSEGIYQPCVIVNPVITMWNPYDVAIDMSWRANLRVALTMASPFSIRFEINNEERVRSLEALGVKDMNIPTNSPSSKWLPGEVRVFSPTGGETVENESGVLNYVVGCNPAGGVRYNIPGLASRPETETLSATEALLVAIHNGPNVQGTGVYYTLKRATSRVTRPPNTSNKSCLLDDLNNAQRMLGENLELTGVEDSLKTLSTSPKPFLAVSSTMRFARDVNDQMSDILVNGIHNMNPTVGYMVASSKEQVSTPIQDRFDTYPFNVLLHRVNSYSDPGMPSGISLDAEGYLGSGFSFSDGLSNLILLEVPKRPLLTIGDLQHFNVNKCNFWPPYTLNALGNSRTSPFIESDKIRVVESSARVVGHDHSYAFNHLMMDDWFVSSITPEMQEWSSSESRGIEEVYEKHLSGEVPLQNHYYKPANPVSESTAAAAASEFLNDSNAWQKVAAELEVKGMFNINSTSELAWAMILKRAFGSDSGGDENGGVLTLTNSTPGAANPSTNLEDSDGSPFPRTALVSDPSAGNAAQTTLSQHKRFTDEQIKALAREIVAEVKKRGPFLSLSEFFNRQLSSDKELALAGAVETALMRLSSTSGSENPYQDIQGNFTDAASSSDLLGQPLTYPFPEAAEGNPAYGFPGWARQADVLRPISGILTARDDTFTIRAYGDVRDPNTDEIIASAWCEAVVQRKADYIDSSGTDGDDKYTLPSDSTLRSEANKRFGRAFEIIQFRWLHPDEV
ncbi:hypothetical protein NT6N_09500 [Oceaniferula spumae]|uniref:Verru_Chthon cassette protein A n=1 Tax=Oceaniferula spumae TaxID=2979115 RepID=A0AAT9FJ01_9BACT